MHFLKCLAIGIAVASGLAGGVAGGLWLAGKILSYMEEKYDRETAEFTLMCMGIFLFVTIVATLICYFSPATHN